MTDSAAVTFGYVGYVWAILGCSSVALLLGVIGATLYVIGKRRERGAPRPVVESLSPAREPAVVARAANPGDAATPGDGAA